MSVQVTEQELQTTILEAARMLGWRAYHQRPAQTRHGWRTAMTGHPGFPDLIIAKPGRVLALELKSARGRVRPDQAEWLRTLDGGVVTARLVYPVDLDDV